MNRGIMYHRLDSSRYGVSKKMFQEQCQWIHSHSKKVEITIDDGHASTMDMVDILDTIDFKAYVFITSDLIDQKKFLTSQQIGEIYRRGHIIGSHGKTHQFLTTVKEERLVEELSESKEKIENVIGGPVEHISFPGGRFDRRILENIKRAKYQKCWSSEPGHHSFETPIKRQGRDCVLNSWSFDYFKKIISNKKNMYLTCRYRTLSGIKSILGQHTYDKITAEKFNE